jgi:hypothetical protein
MDCSTAFNTSQRLEVNMSDLRLGETCTEAYQFISPGTVYTFPFNFEPDKVTFYNLSTWATGGGNLPMSIWFRNQSVAPNAFQVNGSGTFLTTLTNGFTFNDTPAGAPAYRALISGVTKANPCVITTSAPNDFQTDQLIRITDLGDAMPTPRGMSQLDGNRYGIIVLSSTTFSLYDPITLLPIDSTNFETYVSGGRIDVESRVITLNNPQVYPYNPPNPGYIANPFVYNPETWSLTAGTAVMGASGNVFLIEVIKYGQVYNLGILI